MKDKILRMLYKRFAAKFQDYMVEEYIQNIPENVRKQGFAVMTSQKRQLNRFVDYMAFNLHRKMANDITNSERYQGMFIQLKLFVTILQSRPDPKNEDVEISVTQTKTYAENLNHVASFADDMKKLD